MGHTLLVVTLIISEAMSALFKCLTYTNNTAVTEYAENTINKFTLFTVKADVFLVKGLI